MSTLSGPVGAAFAAGPPTLRAWVREVNSRGGLNGHPVNLVFADDTGDPARYRAAVQDLVKNKKAIAFVANLAALTSNDQATSDYLDAQQVPVIGGDLGTPAWDTRPMYFPQGTTYWPMIRSVLASGKAIAPGKKKIGLIYCSEVQGCRDAGSRWPQFAAELGQTVVYSAQMSLVQPDYTAECLGARNAGAELVALVGDVNTVQRVATSCSRQNYKPTYLLPQAVADDREKEVPTLEGTVASLSNFPWVGQHSPAAQEFEAVTKKYGTPLPPSGAAVESWAAAKILEHVGARLTEGTSRELLDGLWAIKDETFGGLTPPLTYARGKPAPSVRCWFIQQIQNGEWTTPLGNGHFCP